MWVGGGPVWPLFFFDTSYFIYEPLPNMFTSDGKTGVGEGQGGGPVGIHLADSLCCTAKPTQHRKAVILQFKEKGKRDPKNV